MFKNKKIIGVATPKKIPVNEKKEYFLKSPFYWCLDRITKMIVNYNCIPFLLTYEGDLIDNYIDIIDMLVLVGDGDIHPKFYGKQLKLDEDMGLMADEKMFFQKNIVNKILVEKVKKIPILGICAGLQSINVAMGGTLIQDIATEVKTNIEHRNGNRKLTDIGHYVSIIDKNSHLYKILQENKIPVSTNHHQAIETLANNFKITAVCDEDNIVEAIEWVEDEICIGVQWHPERYTTEYDSKFLKGFFDLYK